MGSRVSKRLAGLGVTTVAELAEADADAAAELEIQLTAIKALTAVDFYL